MSLYYDLPARNTPIARAIYREHPLQHFLYSFSALRIQRTASAVSVAFMLRVGDRLISLQGVVRGLGKV